MRVYGELLPRGIFLADAEKVLAVAQENLATAEDRACTGAAPERVAGDLARVARSLDHDGFAARGGDENMFPGQRGTCVAERCGTAFAEEGARLDERVLIAGGACVEHEQLPRAVYGEQHAVMLDR